MTRDLSSIATKPVLITKSSVVILLQIACLSLLMVLAGCSDESTVEPDDLGALMGGDDYYSDYSTLPSAGNPASVHRLEASSPGFELEAKFSYVRSYPTGGGTFPVRLNSEEWFTGDVSLSLQADELLNAVIDRHVLCNESEIAEVMIHPDASIEEGTYRIKVTACCPELPNQESVPCAQPLYLEVEVIPWGSPVPEVAETKREELVKWVEKEHPECGDLLRQKWVPYLTYPGILVVEHWTFLSENWEMRICFHVMIPPYDWSMILLRERGEWEPVLAAMREHNGTEYEIHEIPISDYPTFYGY
jgi:hypothetical protein